MRKTLASVIGICALVVATQALAQITFYEGEGFRGRTFTADRTIGNFERYGFNDRASSVVVTGGRWEVCEDARFEGRCVTLVPGNYDSLASFGMDRRISSARPVGEEPRGYAEPPPPVAQEYRQRPGERIYHVEVASARAVMGPPEQRCWVERQQVTSGGEPNIPGAIIGGVLGHQVGSGRGRDVATGVGAVGGAAIGANVGRGNGETYTQDVQRCAAVPNDQRPAYWDVTYYFRGIEHHVQLSGPPGRTIAVNQDGEPRFS